MGAVVEVDAAPMRVRAWQPVDDLDVAALLGPGVDPLWASQFHALHGAPRDGERWRRTLVAEVDGRVVGAATAARNRVHPDRFTCAVDVRPSHRRRGVGRRLLAAVRSSRPEPLPLMSKLRPADGAALGFLAAAGGGVRQRCPGQVVDTGDPRVLAWADQHRDSANSCAADGADLVVGSLQAISAQELAEAFTAQYLWVHASWAPVPPGPPRRALAEVAAATTADADRALSSGAWWRGRLVATVFVFAAGDRWEAVAETVVRDVHSVGVPDELTGADVLRRALARTVLEVAARGGAQVELDGHEDDPHLQLALHGLPLAARRALLLVTAP